MGQRVLQLQRTLKEELVLVHKQPDQTRGIPYSCVDEGCSRTSHDGVSMHKYPADASSPANGLNRYAYIVLTGQGCPPPPHFVACISLATATQENSYEEDVPERKKAEPD